MTVDEYRRFLVGIATLALGYIDGDPVPEHRLLDLSDRVAVAPGALDAWINEELQKALAAGGQIVWQLLDYLVTYTDGSEALDRGGWLSRAAADAELRGHE